MSKEFSFEIILKMTWMFHEFRSLKLDIFRTHQMNEIERLMFPKSNRADMVFKMLGIYMYLYTDSDSIEKANKRFLF